MARLNELGEDALVSRLIEGLPTHAEVLVGAERHLAMVPPGDAERLPWPRPFDALADEIASRRGRSVCVLTTGEPLWYGVGTILSRRFAADGHSPSGLTRIITTMVRP